MRAPLLAGVLAAVLMLAPASTGAVVVPQAGTVEILFTPGDRIDRRIVAAIDAARHDVRVLAYAFTDKAIARALAAAHRRGVDVQVVADRNQARELPHAVIADLARGGVAVWLDGGTGSAHNKVVIVDVGTATATTITGSFNLTRAAQLHNAENVVIFHHNRDVARLYQRYFDARRAQAQRWPGHGARSPRPRGAELRR